MRTNSYSFPLKAGSLVKTRVSSTTVEFRHDGKPIANHQRCYSRMQKILDLEHYLDVLERKPGALRGSTCPVSRAFQLGADNALCLRGPSDRPTAER